MDFTDDKSDFDLRQSALEEMAAEALLVELFNAKKAEVFENVVFEGTRRYYVEDLSERDYSLENTTPYQLDILGHIIEEHAWGLLLYRTADLLLTLFPDYKDKILSFQCQWTKAKMFTLESKTNFKSLQNGFYINCNHTALHACWFLQDMLDFFGIDKSSVSFKEFIKSEFGKSDEYAEKVIRMIEKYLNPMLIKFSKSYTNFFLFDDNAILSNYVKRIREMMEFDLRYDEKVKKVFNKYLDYLVKFYKENSNSIKYRV